MGALQLRSQLQNLINVYPDGTFRPNGYLTRMEFAAILTSTAWRKETYHL
ncbi:MAG: S-layer homology domain-containing protein [Pelatocladus maniniholoensis HA4357-MV3]|uniref:S-layer homology domain-containing protein n=1 Tax=Pelatocladus maniniholoensis HA4357-MV3 TaxID=1117104 RepID=A0A9E3H504_9NOST|nr:S-layer homology domain-containing protein [Pelatocladus maniniholoensis HA4357-MV3]